MPKLLKVLTYILAYLIGFYSESESIWWFLESYRKVEKATFFYNTNLLVLNYALLLSKLGITV